LPLVKGLISVYRGSIEVNSEIGKGTEFIVRIPSDATSGTNPVSITDFPSFALLFGTHAGTYIPDRTAGSVKLGCCVTMGNVDRSTDNVVGMGDLTVMIDNLFITLTPLVCVDEGNLDLSPDDKVTMADLTLLIDNLFITLAPLPPCP